MCVCVCVCVYTYIYVQVAERVVIFVNPGLGGLTSTKLCPGRYEWVEALTPPCLELNLG